MSRPRILIGALAMLGIFGWTASLRAQDPHQTIAGETTASAATAAKSSSSAALSLDALAAAPGELAAGREHFQVHCAPCHGRAGEGGRGPMLALPVLPRATDDAALIRILTSGIGGTEMPPSKLPPTEIARVAAFVKSLGRLPPEKIPGDPVKGRRLYTEKGKCADCHSIAGHGGAFGPDLTSIGARRGAAYLRRALVEPAAEVPQSATPYRADVSLPENFLFVRVTTRDGRSLAGVRVNEDAFSLQLREPSGRVYSFFKSELAELHKDRGFSPMPAYEEVFTSEELDDLVAYLVSLRGQK